MQLCSFVLFSAVLCMTASAQETVTIPLADLQQMRKLAANHDYWKGLAEDREKQVVAANTSAANWKGLFESEKIRADKIQEGRVVAVKDAVADLQRANFELHNQVGDIRQENAELKRDNIKLRASRKYYFIGGVGLGAAGGGYLGYRLGSTTINFPGLSAPQPANQLKFSLKF